MVTSRFAGSALVSGLALSLAAGLAVPPKASGPLAVHQLMTLTLAADDQETAKTVTFALPLPPETPDVAASVSQAAQCAPDIDCDFVSSIPQAPLAGPVILGSLGSSAEPAPFFSELVATPVDITGVKPALALYARGDLAGGDALAKTISDPVARASVDYAALRLMPHAVGYERIMAFLDANPGWPSQGWLAKRAEESLFADKRNARVVKAHFSVHKPQTPAGKLALARCLAAEGDRAGAAALVAEVWREGDINADFERRMKQEFGGFLTRADHKFRADRMLYKESVSAALRAAAFAGPDVVALAQARAAVINEAASDTLIAAVPDTLKDDPGLLFSRIQKLRRAEKLGEAAQLLLSAPRDPALIVDGDEWWTERRLIARGLLDKGDAANAYAAAAGHSARSPQSIIEAEFHAGWIALRYLGDAGAAAHHFAKAAARAETPMSISRARYWQGRAAEAAGNEAEAHGFYEAAAAHSIAYYGQLARARLHLTELPLRLPIETARGDARTVYVRAVEMFYALDERELAGSLAMDIAQKTPSEPQVAALAEIVARQRDARMTLSVGKAAVQRGMALDHSAFPDFGVPGFHMLDGSAERSMVYAIARQESAFQHRAVSGAGAKGLMQMLVSTARRTAQQAHVGFDANRLMSDAAFNAQLGAAHLGVLLNEQKGSYILTFAAYNAGGGRVKEWIDAHGDPRKPGVDPVDWIERIPITETRNYVQRIMENLQVYRLRLGERSGLLIASDMVR